MPQSSSQLRTYGAVYVALLVLLGLTVAAAEVDLGRWNFALAVGIASIKGILIAWFFMHVRGSTALIRMVAVAGLFWLAILFSLSLADYWTRG